DIRMPIMDGRTALAEIRKQPALDLLPVIAVTASSQASEETKLRTQFTGYVRKPFSRHTLYQELAQVLHRVSPTDGPIPAPPPEQAAEWHAMALELRGVLATDGTPFRAGLPI